MTVAGNVLKAVILKLLKKLRKMVQQNINFNIRYNSLDWHEQLASDGLYYVPFSPRAKKTNISRRNVRDW